MNDTRERPGDIYIAEFDSMGHRGMLSLIFLLSISVQRAISEDPRWDRWREARFDTTRKC